MLYQNAGMRLYGGAQYHRAMAEFRFIVGNTKCPEISREEIVNACGVEDIHDGTNYFRFCLPLYMFCCTYTRLYIYVWSVYLKDWIVVYCLDTLNRFSLFQFFWIL